MREEMPRRRVYKNELIPWNVRRLVVMRSLVRVKFWSCRASSSID